MGNEAVQSQSMKRVFRLSLFFFVPLDLQCKCKVSGCICFTEILFCYLCCLDCSYRTLYDEEAQSAEQDCQVKIAASTGMYTSYFTVCYGLVDVLSWLSGADPGHQTEDDGGSEGKHLVP